MIRNDSNPKVKKPKPKAKPPTGPRVPSVPTVFDVVYWFINQALDDKEYLQPQKMQCLLYFAQAYYGVITKGKLLCPSFFVAHENGPVEPNVYRLFEAENRPYIEARMLPEDVEDFLKSLWRKFGSHSASYLTKIAKSHDPYVDAWAAGGAEITLDVMIEYYGRKRTESQSRAFGVPNADQVVRPKALRTQNGRMVTVQSWMPKKAGGD